MEHLAKQFISSPTEKNACVLLQTLRKNNFHHITVVLSNFISNLYPHNIPIICEGAISAFYSDRHKLSYDLYTKALSFPTLSEKESHVIRFNRHFSIPHVSDRYIHYPEKVVKKILQRSKRPIPLVTFTVTTCKRFDLFEQTMNSFLNCCKDLNKIDEWLCVDDNSSEEDRKKMKELYPFFNFYWKSSEEKGHPRSMNIIRDNTKTEFVFHMEDDWKFFCKRNYISDCMSVLSEDNVYGQCLVNKNYAETPQDIGIVGGLSKTAKNGTRYFVHEHTATKEQFEQFNKKYGKQMNCAYWPHFSFRPSLFRRKLLTIIGPFNEKVSHFEMDYSKKYTSLGLKSTFLEGIYCLHIGRLTSERNDQTIPNSYTLNGEAQFSDKEKPDKIDIGNGIETFVVNLTRRADRLKTFDSICPVKYTKFSAVDGKKLKPTIQLQQLFENNDYNMRRGIVGCALSHIKLLVQLVNSDKNAYCILEDDITFTDNFVDKVQQVLKKLENSEWDFIYLGHSLYLQYREKGCYDKTTRPNANKWNKPLSLLRSMGGAYGYIITKKGAEKMLNFINTNSMTNAIDTVFQKAIDDVNTFYCYPHLVFTECVLPKGQGNGKFVDSDIQRDFVSLTIPLNDRLDKEVKFYGKDSIVNVSTEEELTICKDANVIFYKNPPDGVNKYLLGKRSYMVGNTLIIVSNPSKEHMSARYFDRLKKNGTWDIDDVFEDYVVEEEEEKGEIVKVEKKVVKANVEGDFVFIPTLDQIGHDIYMLSGSIEEFKSKALSDPNCAGFNTLGFFKDKIDNLTTSQYFSDKDGIFIKKQYLPVDLQK